MSKEEEMKKIEGKENAVKKEAGKKMEHSTTSKSLQRIDYNGKNGYKYKIRRRYVDEEHMKKAFIRIINRSIWQRWLKEMLNVPSNRNIYFHQAYTGIIQLDDSTQYRYGWKIERISKNKKGILYQIYVYDYIEDFDYEW